MILEAALGDAYGAGFEFASREKIDRLNTLSGYERHPRHASIYRRYTDDTQMALAIAEFMLGNRPWSSVDIAEQFVNVFKRDPRLGYGRKFYDALNVADNGEELLKLVDSNSKRNGAVMRAYPIGLYPHTREVMECAGMQATITHNTPEAITSAKAVALMQHYSYYRKGPLKDLPAFLMDIQGIRWNSQWTGEVQIDAVQSAEAVLSILANSPPSLNKMLVNSVALGGDADTVASLVMAIASQCVEVENDLPPWLSEELDEDRYGVAYLAALDLKLMRMFPVKER